MIGIDRTYIRGFKLAADNLVAHLLGAFDDREAEVIFAIGFLYRHYLELECKYLIRSAWELNNSTPFVPQTGHGLRRLWDDTRKAIEKELPEFTSVPFDSVQSIMYQFDHVDSSGQEFRYATTNKGNPSLEKLPSRISVEALRDAMARAETFLDQWACDLENCFDDRQES
jgi:hypothetical protein